MSRWKLSDKIHWLPVGAEGARCLFLALNRAGSHQICPLLGGKPDSSPTASRTITAFGILSKLHGTQSGAQPSTTGQDAGAGQQGKPALGARSPNKSRRLERSVQPAE
jgi:hypothetical protein